MTATRAAPEALDTVPHRAGGSEHHHSDRRTVCDESSADIVAVGAGQIAVRHHHVVVVDPHTGEGVVTVEGDVDGHPVPPSPDEGQQVKYAACMRANGVPNYRDPSRNETNFRTLGIDPNSPFFQNANKVCGTKVGAPSWWINGAGKPGEIEVSSGPGPGGPPAGANTAPRVSGAPAAGG